jgi:glycerophosphoryl diester phosphodiesterase
MELLRGERPVVKVGHRGAPGFAGDNSLASIAAAVELGFDAIEIDVLRLDGRLVVAHDARHANAAPALDDALGLLADYGAAIQLDLKGTGHERAVAEAVRRHALVDRSFASTPSLSSLRALAAAEPELARAFTYPDDRFGLTGRRALRPAVMPTLRAMRRALPFRLPRLLRRAGARATTLNWTVVSPAVVERCHALGVAVYAWTVNDRGVAAALLRMGADGIITDDPRIFDEVPTT